MVPGYPGDVCIDDIGVEIVMVTHVQCIVLLSVKPDLYLGTEGQAEQQKGRNANPFPGSPKLSDEYGHVPC